MGTSASELLYLARIEPGFVPAEFLTEALSAGSSIRVTNGVFHWRILFSRVGLLYIFRTLQTIHVAGPNTLLTHPKLIGIWVDGKFAGHAMTFLPSRKRLPFLFGQRIRELTYMVEENFRDRGLGTFLVAHWVQVCHRERTDVIGLIRQSNASSLRVFDKFHSKRTLVRRRHQFFRTSYSPCAREDEHQELNLDKNEERNRYDLSAQDSLKDIGADSVNESDFGAVLLAPPLRTPYICYERRLGELIWEGATVLELGAGTGSNSLAPLKAGAKLAALDISVESLKVLARRVSQLGFSVQPIVGDIENLPFPSDSFDFVISAGSLSYGDNQRVMEEILRVLSSGGMFICVDSLDNNPIYRANRVIHYLRGRRSKGTLLNMPSIQLIDSYKAAFASVEAEFFGAISFMAGILTWCFGSLRAKMISDQVDRWIGVRRLAFKFVMTAKKRVDDGRKH